MSGFCSHVATTVRGFLSVSLSCYDSVLMLSFGFGTKSTIMVSRGSDFLWKIAGFGPQKTQKQSEKSPGVLTNFHWCETTVPFTSVPSTSWFDSKLIRIIWMWYATFARNAKLGRTVSVVCTAERFTSDIIYWQLEYLFFSQVSCCASQLVISHVNLQI